MPSFEKLLAIADVVVQEAIKALPESLREAAEKLPVSYEDLPDPEMEDEEEFDPDLLGLFVGEDYHSEGETFNPVPAQIILYLENIWDYAEGDKKTYRDEVKLTYLHELGHYLGLDEDDLYDRGMD